MATKDKKQIVNILANSRSLKYKKNDFIFRPGDPYHYIEYLKSGYIRIYEISKNGQEVSLHIYGPGSFLPGLYSPSSKKRRYYADALTSVEILQAQPEDIIKAAQSDSEFLMELLNNYMSTYYDLLARVEYLASGDAYTKVASVLVLLAGQAEPKKTTGVSLDFSATHRLIASLTGLTRETVTLQMLKLKKNGFISGKGRRLSITDLNKLREETSSEE
ncbi:MAG: Crp/Fnr family transcriptional regulator [Patescibacteria group bacterium]|jgi:CRP-like cAMP-binding protein